MLVKIYTDGAARGNPDGPGGYGTVLEYVDTKGELHIKELSQGYVRTTNNRMELMAVIAGLEALNRACEVEVYSDSKYVVDAFNQHWVDSWLKKGWKRGKNEPVKNIDLWKRLLSAKEKHQVRFCWVKGHDGHPQNERCDTLATTAADGTALIVDEGVDM
ncbi:MULTISPECIES: ribonuclease HI [Lachnospiraceae]|jgi:ribonuclease HI|uniref:Ribonuclease H n=2 Tax=Lachnospiraceae TaxID=186803 RepID=A0ABT2TAE1_9FIRM|nr:MULTISPECIES: ribonuclease HI [Lachnospiraceae]MCU6746786.1 ribonuclease HI [Faecalicatena acetigenes]RGT74607.1 ribonuclease HI [Ruminococcus sp. AF18-22]SCH41652.1 Ribonuclease HI [uncultured Clostridium sp.]